MMPLDHAFKTAAFGDANRIDKIALRENIRRQSRPRLDIHREIAELANSLDRLQR